MAKKKLSKMKCGTSSYGGAFYGLGILGAVIYYLSIATGFWNGVLGVLKAIIWPVFFVYKIFGFIGA